MQIERKGRMSKSKSVYVRVFHDLEFFVVRSNDSFNFPLGWIKYIVIVNCSHGNRVYSDFGVQGEEASFIVFNWISSFLKRNKNLNVYLEGFLRCRALLMVIHTVCTFRCHAMLKASEHTNNLWPSSHPSAQSTWIAGKSYCTSTSFYHRIALLMCLVMAYGWERTTHFLKNKSTIAKGFIHWWVPPIWHMSRRYTDNHLV